MTVAALQVHAGAPTVAGYTFALAAALLLGFNRRQYIDRAEQADLLLAQAERARREQARAAALDERTRIARDIHDVLAHSLGALAVQLDVTEALLDDGAEHGDGPSHVSRARRFAVDGLAEARRAVTALRGDTLPLPLLLDGLIAQYRTDSGAPARLQITGTRASAAAGRRAGRCSAPRRRRSTTPANTPARPVTLSWTTGRRDALLTDRHPAHH